MSTVTERDAIERAIDTLVERNPQSTDGKWLEYLTAEVAPQIKEWDIKTAYMWGDWPERQHRYPDTTNRDVGIDVVAIRRSDNEHVAIQCKARQLDEQGRGDSISPRETDRCITTSNDAFWAERWLVTNGDNRVSSPLMEVLSMQGAKPLKVVNVHKDLVEERDSSRIDEDCPHCQSGSDEESPRQTKTCMQNEAVVESVRVLQEHVEVDSGGLPVGQARGKEAYDEWTTEEEHFLRLLSEWRKETAFQSSPRAITNHSAYQQIIDLGKPVLPFIFKDMRENGGWWYPALRAITGDNPVPKDARGNRTLNDEAWLRWGQDHGYA